MGVGPAQTIRRIRTIVFLHHWTPRVCEPKRREARESKKKKPAGLCGDTKREIRMVRCLNHLGDAPKRRGCENRPARKRVDHTGAGDPRAIRPEYLPRPELKRWKSPGPTVRTTRYLISTLWRRLPDDTVCRPSPSHSPRPARFRLPKREPLKIQANHAWPHTCISFTPNRSRDCVHLRRVGRCLRRYESARAAGE